MSKSLLHKLFGIGKVPVAQLEQLKREGVLFHEEGIGGSVTYKRFKSPGRRCSWKRQWYTCSIVLTKTRLIAFSYSNKVIDVPLDDERIFSLNFFPEKNNKLCVSFDAGLFHTDWSGQIEYRFNIESTQEFLDQLCMSASICEKCNE